MTAEYKKERKKYIPNRNNTAHTHLTIMNMREYLNETIVL